MPVNSSLSIRRAFRRIDTFEPMTPQELSRLVAKIHAELDEIAIDRGDVDQFAKRGELKPPAEYDPTPSEL